MIWLQNDNDRDLYNGTLGKVIGVNYSAGSEPALICDFEGARQEIPAGELYKMGLAYAVTCHKFQGSSAPIVIIPVVKSRLIDAILLYTAVTRAECQIVLVGDRALFVEAVLSAPRSLMRNVGLSARELRERIVRESDRKAA